MKKLTLILAAFALAFGGFTATTASASAAAPVDPSTTNLKIVQVGTDAMGTDTYGNRNREFVTFKNASGHALDIKDVLVEDNWARAKTLADAPHSCNTYKITSLPDNAGTTVIADGAIVTVFNGSRWGGDYKTASGEYRLYANSDVDCGTAGHFYNNNNDRVWIALGKKTITTHGWDWNGGYTVKP